MTEQPDTAHLHDAGARLVRAGGVLFVLGTVATGATLVPFFTGGERLPTWAYAASMLAPLGFAVALTGLVRDIRARHHPRRPGGHQ